MKKLLAPCILLIITLGCNRQNGIIQSRERLEDISRMLEVQKKLTSHSLILVWKIFNQPMSANERQALEFLYAYMPLSDLADYNGELFLTAVRQSLKAREEMPWGRSVPEDLFLHFVLPVRVNNENLDSFRIVMYQEIKSRIAGLSMHDAALEINHWCHEKVTYRGTDSRTSAPLDAIRKSFGRCGEETTFTVSAMRTAGIPARQVYTPRWAHVDDNHAWVEVWIDGGWYYLGACEPEPELNMGWFTEPSHRAMLVHTRAYGRYFGHEEVINPTDRFSELNLTARYAPVKTFAVKALDRNSHPIDSAKITFGLYNYAEFYPIATQYTDNTGIARLTCGLGTLLVWAVHNEWFDFRMISVPETDTLVLTIDKKSIPPHTGFYDVIPPKAIKVTTRISGEKRTESTNRFAREDSIRNSYMGTFRDKTWADSLASRLGLGSDTVNGIIGKTFGNWPEIQSYLEKNHHGYRNTVLALAVQLSDKDFSDANESVLTDHLRNTIRPKGMDSEIFEKWVLSPRIDLEKLSPWRGFLRTRMGDMAGKITRDMSELTDWIQKNIIIDETANLHSRAPLTPIGVYNLRVADSFSRDIFYVAACRSMGIPARINPVDRTAEYYSGGKWHQAWSGSKAELNAKQGLLQLTQSGNPLMPRYYTHFTLSRMIRGTFKTLEFDEGKNLSDFPSVISLDTGQYMLVTGNRTEDGSVFSSLTFFNIQPDTRITIPVSLRTQPGGVKPSGRINPEGLQIKVPGKPGAQRLASLSRGKKMILLLVDPEKEPSRHVLDELGSQLDHFKKWDGRFFFVLPTNKDTGLDAMRSFNLPSDNICGIDLNNNILKELDLQFGPDLEDRLPLVVLCSPEGLVYLFSSGYKIGVVDQLVKLAD